MLTIIFVAAAYVGGLFSAWLFIPKPLWLTNWWRKKFGKDPLVPLPETLGSRPENVPANMASMRPRKR